MKTIFLVLFLMFPLICFGQDNIIETGDIQVRLYPIEATQSGASWKLLRQTPFGTVNYSNWMSSGSILFDVPVGTYQLLFKDISNWTTPLSRLVVITHGSMLNISADYFSKPGELQVSIQPYNIKTLGAQWRVDDRDWISSNEVLTLEEGFYTIYFRNIIGWKTPQTYTIQIKQNERRTLRVIYSRLSSAQAQNVFYPGTNIFELRNTIIPGNPDIILNNIIMQLNSDGTLTILEVN